VHRAPRQNSEHVERLYELFEEHGEARMQRALDVCVERGDLSIVAVQRVLTSKRGAR
jgi:hypothetical protein